MSGSWKTVDAGEFLTGAVEFFDMSNPKVPEGALSALTKGNKVAFVVPMDAMDTQNPGKHGELLRGNSVLRCNLTSVAFVPAENGFDFYTLVAVYRETYKRNDLSISPVNDINPKAEDHSLICKNFRMWSPKPPQSHLWCQVLRRFANHEGTEAGWDQFFRPLHGSPRQLESGRDEKAQKNAYRKQWHDSPDHDEPWLTLMAFWGLFGETLPSGTDADRCKAINTVLQKVYARKLSMGGVVPSFSEVPQARLEIKLPEITAYREDLHNGYQKAGEHYLHPYRDIRYMLRNTKLAKKTSSLEGSTNLDGLMHGPTTLGNDRNIGIFIEAKFLSDISYKVTYCLARNQIARNIDAALDFMTPKGGKIDEAIPNTFFLLLTPRVFLPAEYGGQGSMDAPFHNPYQQETSRFYSYKMKDYLTPQNLINDLPHRRLSPTQAEDITRRIGWITYEDIVQTVKDYSLLSDTDFGLFRAFFEERGIVA